MELGQLGIGLMRVVLESLDEKLLKSKGGKGLSA